MNDVAACLREKEREWNESSNGKNQEEPKYPCLGQYGKGQRHAYQRFNVPMPSLILTKCPSKDRTYRGAEDRGHRRICHVLTSFC